MQLLDDHDETAARTQAQLRLLFGIQLNALLAEGKVAALAVRDRRCSLFYSQRSKVDRHFTRGTFTVDSCHIPLLATASGQHDELAGLAGEKLHLIPNARHA